MKYCEEITKNWKLWRENKTTLKKNNFAKRCKGKDAAVYAIESDEDQEEISVVEVQAMKDKSVC